MKRYTPYLMSVAAFAMCGIALGREKTPTLRYVAEHTETKTVRDMVRFRGKIWTATEGGIAVYDRKEARFLFKLTSIHGLFGNSVRALSPTPNDTLLAVGEFGTAEISGECVEASAACITQVRTFSSDTFDPAVDIVQGTAPLVLRHQSGLHRIGAPAEPSLTPGSAAMWRAAVRESDGIVMGGTDGRLVRIHNDTETPLLQLDKPVLDMVSAAEGTLILTGAAPVLFQKGRIKPVRLGAETPAISALSADTAGPLAGGTDGAIYRYRKGELFSLGRVDGRITALLGDGNAIWVGVEGRGLVRFSIPQQSAEATTGPQGEICSNHVTRFTMFGGRPVAATFDNGACVLTESGWQMLEGTAGQFVHGAADDGKLLWIATSNGILRFDAALKPVPLTETDPKEVNWFAASAVIALAETDDGIALGAPWGVVRVVRKDDGYTARFISRFRGSPEHITALTGAPGGILAASETDGVRFVGKRRKQTRIYLDPVHLPEAWILDVSETKNGFWAATCQNGVSFVSEERGIFINSESGLVDNRTVAVAAYKTGAFIATLGGLSYADRNGRARAPFAGPLPDPRGAAAELLGNALYLGTESGTAVFEISR